MLGESAKKCAGNGFASQMSRFTLVSIHTVDEQWRAVRSA